MRDLIARRDSDPRAADAVDLFCYQAKKYIVALAAALDGVDTLVFAGGIGENASPIRERICAGLGYLGVRLDTAANAACAAVISALDSKVRVRVIRTNEELIVARHAKSVVGQPKMV